MPYKDLEQGKEYRRLYRIKNKAKREKWVQENIERLKQWRKDYAKKNRDRINQREREFYWKNRDEHIRKRNEYWAKKPERYKEVKRLSYIRNYKNTLIRNKIYLHNRRCSLGLLSAAKIKKVFRKTNNSCFYCGIRFVQEDFFKRRTIDHYFPIKPKRGNTIKGTNHLSNLVPACFSCNARKKNTTGEEYFTLLDKEKESKFVEAFEWLGIIQTEQQSQT